MAWRFHGRARVDARNPRAFGVCERCSFWYNLQDLTWQYEWAGSRLNNTRHLVCETCLDVPQQQLRSIILPADPQPVFNARPQDFDIANNDYRVTQDDQFRVTQDGSYRVVEETGDQLPVPL